MGLPTAPPTTPSDATEQQDVHPAGPARELQPRHPLWLRRLIYGITVIATAAAMLFAVDLVLFDESDPTRDTSTATASEIAEQGVDAPWKEPVADLDRTRYSAVPVRVGVGERALSAQVTIEASGDQQRGVVSFLAADRDDLDPLAVVIYLAGTPDGSDVQRPEKNTALISVTPGTYQAVATYEKSGRWQVFVQRVEPLDIEAPDTAAA